MEMRIGPTPGDESPTPVTSKSQNISGMHPSNGQPPAMQAADVSKIVSAVVAAQKQKDKLAFSAGLTLLYNERGDEWLADLKRTLEESDPEDAQIPSQVLSLLPTDSLRTLLDELMRAWRPS